MSHIIEKDKSQLALGHPEDLESELTFCVAKNGKQKIDWI